MRLNLPALVLASVITIDAGAQAPRPASRGKVTIAPIVGLVSPTAPPRGNALEMTAGGLLGARVTTPSPVPATRLQFDFGYSSRALGPNGRPDSPLLMDGLGSVKSKTLTASLVFAPARMCLAAACAQISVGGGMTRRDSDARVGVGDMVLPYAARQDAATFVLGAGVRIPAPGGRITIDAQRQSSTMRLAWTDTANHRTNDLLVSLGYSLTLGPGKR